METSIPNGTVNSDLSYTKNFIVCQETKNESSYDTALTSKVKIYMDRHLFWKIFFMNWNWTSIIHMVGALLFPGSDFTNMDKL